MKSEAHFSIILVVLLNAIDFKRKKVASSIQTRVTKNKLVFKMNRTENRLMQREAEK
jgi:hypothetical protein